MPWMLRARMRISNARSQGAGGGGECKEACAEDEDQTPAEQVAERAASENQRAEKQSVGFNDPLHIDDGGVKALLQRGQRDVDRGAVDEGHAGGEDGGGRGS